MVQVLILLVCGCAVGVLASFFGVGGGILAIPTMYAVFKNVPPLIVIASSLCMISMNSLLNSILYLRKRTEKTNWNMIAVMAVAMAVGVIGGGMIAVKVNPKILKLIFGLLCLAVSARLVLSRGKVQSESEGWNEKDNIVSLIISAFAGGIVAGLTGLGGGAIMVPLFISFVKMPVKRVPLYSNMMMSSGAFIGTMKYAFFAPSQTYFNDSFLSYGQVGAVNFILSASLFLGALATARFGVKLNDKVSPEKAKLSFAVLLFVVGVRIVLKHFSIL